jgi:hypothetical protein
MRTIITGNATDTGIYSKTANRKAEASCHLNANFYQGKPALTLWRQLRWSCVKVIISRDKALSKTSSLRYIPIILATCPFSWWLYRASATVKKDAEDSVF